MKGLKNTCIIRALAAFTSVALLAAGICLPTNAQEEIVGPIVEFVLDETPAPVLQYSEPIGPKDLCERSHDMVLESVLRESTCSSAGVSVYVCNNCGFKEERPEPCIDITKHLSDGGTVVKQATETEPGEIEYRCIYCNQVIKEEIIPILSKRTTPTAIFNPLTCTLSNIPNDSLVSVNGSLIDPKAANELNLENMFSEAGEYKIYVMANAGAEGVNSNVQEIAVFKPSAPSQVMTVDAKADSTIGYMLCAEGNMEYKAVEDTSWTTCLVAKEPVAVGTYLVRYKATGTSLASNPVTVEVKGENITSNNGAMNIVQAIVNTIKGSSEAKSEEKADKKQTDTESKGKSNPVIVVEKDEEALSKSNSKAENKYKEDKPVKEENKEDSKKDAEKEDKTELEEIDSESALEEEDTKKEVERIEYTIGATAVSVDKGWDNVMKSMENIDGTVVLHINEKMPIPAVVFKKAVETQNILLIYTGDVARWVIRPDDINVEEVELLGSINLGLSEIPDHVPEEAIKSLENKPYGQKVDHVFDIMHEGNFGFKADCTIKVPEGTPSEYAGLFCYNPLTKKMDFVDCAKVRDNKEVTFEMTHASGYAVVVAPTELSQESIKELEEKEEVAVVETLIVDQSNTTKSNSAKPIIIGSIITVVLFLIIAALVYLYSQKKDELPFDIKNFKKK